MPAHVSYKKWHARQKPSPHASMPKIKLQNQLGNLKKLEKLEKSSFFKFFSRWVQPCNRTSWHADPVFIAFQRFSRIKT